jgi:hypothetical protein
MVVPSAPTPGTRLRLPLPRSPKGVVVVDRLRTTVSCEQTSRVALHSRRYKSVAGYVAVLGNAAVGPGTDAGVGVKPGAPSSSKLLPNPGLAA